MAILISRTNPNTLVITMTERDHAICQAETDEVLRNDLRYYVSRYADGQMETRENAIQAKLDMLPTEKRAEIEALITEEAEKVEPPIDGDHPVTPKDVTPAQTPARTLKYGI